MVRIEHAAIYVKELDRARDFFVKYFDAVSNDGYTNPKTGFRSYFLSFDDGARLEIMHKPNLAEQADPRNRYGYAHIAFSVGSKAQVDRLTERIQADGYTVISSPRTTGDGYYESCVADLDGNQIEITV